MAWKEVRRIQGLSKVPGCTFEGGPSEKKKNQAWNNEMEATNNDRAAQVFPPLLMFPAAEIVTAPLGH